jgi:A/G-specific adenine glycosylase
LPWQRSRDPYAIWVSEIMLQQTQVATVIPYYERFMLRFPTCSALAEGPLDEVMRLWSGLGYYSRARNLHSAARTIAERHGAVFPRAFDRILELPGIGRSTAAAIAALAFGERRAILDGNVKRVVCRAFGIDGDPTSGAVERALWSLAESLLPEQDIEPYTQGLMDLGATICLRRGAKCSLCPVSNLCIANHEGRVDALPRPRVRKSQPQRETVMLLLHHEARVLLEKRPPAGIWGALWSLPEADPRADLEVLCRDRFGVCSASLTALPSIEHGFTHFRLRIHPRRVDVVALDARLREPGYMWMPLAEALDAAVPGPVKQILRML